MYLDFIKDIYQIGNSILLNTKDDVVLKGEIIKISSNLIALKLEDGNVIIKNDSEIKGITLLTSDTNTLEGEESNVTSQSKIDIKNSHPVVKEQHEHILKKRNLITLTDKETNEIKESFDFLLLKNITLDDIIKTNATLERKINNELWEARNVYGKQIKVLIDNCILNNDEPKTGTKIFCIGGNNGIVYRSIEEMSFQSIRDKFIKSLVNRNYKYSQSILHALRLISGNEQFKIIEKVIKKIKNCTSTYSDHIYKIKPLLDATTEFKDKVNNKYNTGNQITIGTVDSTWSEINKDSLTKCSYIIKKKIPYDIKQNSLSANAYVTEVRKRTFNVQINNNPSKFICTKTIIERKLFESLSKFQIGDFLPIIIFSHKDKEDQPILALSPMTIGQLIDLLISSIEEGHYTQTKLICYFLLSVEQINSIRKQIFDILNLLKPISIFNLESPILFSSTKGINNDISVKSFEKRIDELVKNKQHNIATKEIIKYLEDNNIGKRYVSSLLLKKAQIYSSIKDYPNAIQSYIQLIEHIENNNGEAENLSHLYTELARLQSFNEDYGLSMLQNLHKAIDLNQNNRYATLLLDKVVQKKRQVLTDPTNNFATNSLEIESEDTIVTISKMIDSDIREFNYTDNRIMANGGVPSPEIARSILIKAKSIRNVDLSERFPNFLEAAKAYSELPIGSYDFNEYIEAAAYYSILKGNALYLRFRKMIQDGEKSLSLLTSIKDSACSYYIESLNLLYNIPPTYLLTILSNYLKLNIAILQIQNNVVPNFKGNFKQVFYDAIKSNVTSYNEIAWEVVIAIGSTSAKAWNQLCTIKGGTSDLYGIFGGENKREEIYKLINSICGEDLNSKLSPGEFLKKSFSHRKKEVNACNLLIKKLINLDINFRLIETINEKWIKIQKYLKLFNATDISVKENIDKIHSIMLPYPNRNAIERTNLLVQCQNIIEKQITYIKNNPTFYGRTFFLPFLSNWNNAIKRGLDQRRNETLPSLLVVADPPYIVYKNGIGYINFLVINKGESTADGFIFRPQIQGINSEEYKKAERVFSVELSSSQQHEVIMNLPSTFNYGKALSVSVEIQAIYQGNNTPTSKYDFTIEEEPSSNLTFEDIPWNDGRIPEKHMFKGREKDLDTLARHYCSIEKDKPYILYGLTRTGKSSILKYLGNYLRENQGLKNRQIVTFQWDLSEAAMYKNAQDLWQYFVGDQIYEELEKYIPNNLNKFKISSKPRAKDLSKILLFMKENHLYPIFLVDEFSFIKILLDEGVINPAFLHTLRQFSLEGLASFIFAGTYDIKDLLKDQKYGITGQLVNAIEKQIGAIDEISARELIRSLGKRLEFTEAAISHIFELSGKIPYFIQMICKNCGYYAVENKRSIIGYPELEIVIKQMTGEIIFNPESKIKVLPENVFQNNMFNPADPKEVNVLITSICTLNNKNKERARGIGMVELQQLWGKHNVQAFIPKLASSIELLVEKKVIKVYEDEGLPVYKITVDLFRRWWQIHHLDLELEINTILNS